MQLSDMKSHPVIKWLAYFGFGLIIISFIFFYGWDTSATASFERQNSYGRIESDSALSFLPWRKWENVSAAEVRNARPQVANRKLSTLDQTMQFLLLQEAQRMGLRLDQRLSSDPEALQQAVDLRLMLREADRIGLHVIREEIISQIRSQPGMNENIWRQILAAEGVSEAEYIDRMRRNQTAFEVQELKADEVRMTLPELWAEYQFENEKLRLEVLDFPSSGYVDEVSVSEADMQAYLDENAETYRVPDRRQYGYVTLDQTAIRDSIQPDDEAVKAFFEENQESFRIAEAALVEDFFAPVSEDQATTVAEQLLREAKSAASADPGASWETVRDAIRSNHPEARFYYRDTGPIENSSEERTLRGVSYVEAALGLSEGDLSDIVEGKDGLHVIRRTGTRPSTIPDFASVNHEVRIAYVDAEAQRIFDERVGVMRNSMGDFASLEKFASEHGFEYGVTGMIDASSVVLPEVADISEHRSYLRTLATGTISEPIPLGDRVVGLQIIKEEPSYVPALDEVREEIDSRLRKQRALDRAEEKARTALQSVRDGREVLAVARDEGSTTTLTPPLTRRSFERGSAESNLDSVLVGFSEQTAKAGAGITGISPAAPAPGADPDGYALWRIRDIEAPIREQFMEARHDYARTRQPLKESILIEEWLADLRSEVDYEVFGLVVP